MQIHELKIKTKVKKKRIARGGKRGTYSGRGMKGQKSRAGRKMEPAVRGAFKKYPKLRGYKFKSFKDRVILNLAVLNKEFNDGEKITPEILFSKNLVRRIRGKIPKIKILGTGDIDKKIEIQGCEFSEEAKKKIEKAGGKAESVKCKAKSEKQQKRKQESVKCKAKK